MSARLDSQCEGRRDGGVAETTGFLSSSSPHSLDPDDGESARTDSRSLAIPLLVLVVAADDARTSSIKYERESKRTTGQGIFLTDRKKGKDRRREAADTQWRSCSAVRLRHRKRNSERIQEKKGDEREEKSIFR